MISYFFILILSFNSYHTFAATGGSDERVAASGVAAKALLAPKTAKEEEFLTYLLAANERFSSKLRYSSSEIVSDAKLGDVWADIKYLRNIKERDFAKATPKDQDKLFSAFNLFLAIWSQAYSHDLRALSCVKSEIHTTLHSSVMEAQAGLDPFLYYMTSLMDTIIPKFINVGLLPPANPWGLIKTGSTLIYQKINGHYFTLMDDIPDTGFHRVFMSLPSDVMVSHDQPSVIFNDAELVHNSGLWLSAREFKGDSFVRIQRHFGIDVPQENHFTVFRTTMNIPVTTHLGSLLMADLESIGEFFIPFPLDALEQLCLEAELLDALCLEWDIGGKEVAAPIGILPKLLGLMPAESLDASGGATALESSAAMAAADLSFQAHLAGIDKEKASILTALEAKAEAHAVRIQAEHEARRAAVIAGTIPERTKVPVKKAILGGGKFSKSSAPMGGGKASACVGGASAKVGASASLLAKELEGLKAEIIGKRRLKFRMFARMLARLYSHSPGGEELATTVAGSHRSIHDPLGVLTYVKPHGSGDLTLPASRAASILERAYEGLVALINKSAVE